MPTPKMSIRLALHFTTAGGLVKQPRARSQPDVWALLSSLVGSRVGLETDTGGGSNAAPFSFAYFKTNLGVTQTEDDFAGSFSATIPWTWEFPGNGPANTEDPAHYAFSANSLDITAQSGPGKLLGNLLGGLAHLLDSNANSLALLNKLNKIAGEIAALV